MKKFVCALIALALMLTPAALAEQARPQELTAQDGIIALENNASIDLDLDGEEELVSYELSEDDYSMGKMTITVNDATLELDVEAGIEQLYAGCLNGDYDGIFLLVGEMGPSDDPYSHIIRYCEGELTDIGGICALPGDIAINGNVLTAVVRGRTLQTWYREGDFVIASSLLFDENNDLLPAQYYVAESPRASYPMGTVVVFKRDVETTTALVGGQKLTFREGETAILTATDDNSYVYVVPADMSAHDWLPGGYLMLGEDFGCVIVDGESVFAGEVMDGLIYAD